MVRIRPKFVKKKSDAFPSSFASNCVCGWMSRAFLFIQQPLYSSQCLSYCIGVSQYGHNNWIWVHEIYYPEGNLDFLWQEWSLNWQNFDSAHCRTVRDHDDLWSLANDPCSLIMAPYVFKTQEMANFSMDLFWYSYDHTNTYIFLTIRFKGGPSEGRAFFKSVSSYS